VSSDVRRKALLLAAALVSNSGMFQVAAALALRGGLMYTTSGATALSLCAAALAALPAAWPAARFRYNPPPADSPSAAFS
jgi:hypothetical protein